MTNTYTGSVTGDSTGLLVTFQTGTAAYIVWSEEFSGAAGAALPSTFQYDLSGGNNNLQYNNPDVSGSYHNSLQDGKSNLVLAAREESYDGYSYTGAQVFSTSTIPNPGFVEISAQLPTEYNVWPALWALGSPVVGWPFCGETDLVDLQTANGLALIPAGMHYPDSSVVTDHVQTGSAIIGSATATTFVASTPSNFISGADYIIDFGTGAELVAVTNITGDTITVTRNVGENGASSTIPAGNPIYPNNSVNYGGSQFAASLPGYDGKWHRWGVYWTGSEVIFYRDGQAFWSVATDALTNAEGGTETEIGEYPFERQQVVYLSLYVGGSNAGNPISSTIFPVYAYIDYVRCYNRPPY